MIRKPGIEFLALWLAVMLLLPCCALADSAYGDFVYILNTDGQAVITHYTGRDKNVELPWNIEGKMVAEIGPEAFAGNTTIETVKLPIGVTVIREKAFKGCANLKSVEFPSRLETIEEGVFLGCTALKELEIPESVVEINMECFENWTMLMGNENSIAVDYAKALGLNYRETCLSEILGDNEKAIESLSEKTDPVNAAIQVTPDSLMDPGEVNVSLRVFNPTGEDMISPVTLFDPDGNVVASFGDGGSYVLESGDSRSWEGKWNVTQAQLDAGAVVYTLRYHEEDASGSLVETKKGIFAKITFTGERVSLSVNRTFSPEAVRSGSQATVKYELYNNGNVNLTDIRVQENISKTAKTVETLAAGERVAVEFTSRIGNADLVSNATITYKAAGSAKTEKITVEDAIIPLAKPDLKIELSSPTAAVNVGEAATLIITFTNAGNVSYSNVTVKESKKGEILTNLSIPAGATVTETKDFILMEPTTFKVTATLPDNTGETHTVRAEELTIDVVDSEKYALLTGTDQKQTEIARGWISECDMYFNQYGLLNFDLTNYEPYEAEGRGIIYFFRPEHGSHFGQGAVSGYVLFDIVKPEIVYEYAIWCGSDDYAGVVAELGSDQVPTSAWIKFYVTDDQQIIIISSDVAINILESK